MKKLLIIGMMAVGFVQQASAMRYNKAYFYHLERQGKLEKQQQAIQNKEAQKFIKRLKFLSVLLRENKNINIREKMAEILSDKKQLLDYSDFLEELHNEIVDPTNLSQNDLDVQQQCISFRQQLEQNHASYTQKLAQQRQVNKDLKFVMSCGASEQSAGNRE